MFSIKQESCCFVLYGVSLPRSRVKDNDGMFGLVQELIKLETCICMYLTSKLMVAY